jgi:ribosomal-protein-serine acetyltransferase
MNTFKIEPDIELRQVDQSLAVPLFNLVDKNRNHLRTWLPWVDSTKSPADTAKFIEMCQNQFSKNDGFQCAVFHKGEICGMVGFHGVNWPNQKTSLGYWLAENKVGFGIMTKASKALVDHAFKTMKLHRVEIRTATANTKSRAIPERLGFKHEGVSRGSEKLSHGFVDHDVFALLATDL